MVNDPMPQLPKVGLLWAIILAGLFMVVFSPLLAYDAIRERRQRDH